MEGIVSAAGTLLLVVVILALCYVATRKIGKIQLGMGAGGGKYISILDRQALGQDKAVALVKVGDRYLLLGIAVSQVSLLAEVPCDEVTEEGSEKQEAIDFNSIMEKLKDRKK